MRMTLTTIPPPARKDKETTMIKIVLSRDWVADRTIMRETKLSGLKKKLYDKILDDKLINNTSVGTWMTSSKIIEEIELN